MHHDRRKSLVDRRFEFLGACATELRKEIDRLRDQRNALLAICKNAKPGAWVLASSGDPDSVRAHDQLVKGIAKIEAAL